VLDATAGLGEDAWLMAAAGCRVVALERDAVVHALLTDGLRRAAAVRPDITERITLHRGSMFDLVNDTEAHGSHPWASGGDTFDVVYLDPMFPPGRKTAERKPMRVLRWRVGDDGDADALLARALELARRRVVVKRPRHAAPLAGRPPTHAHHGKSLRYDVYAAGESISPKKKPTP
jgi:16S rRNA (guanine1516-N2)-methyltransferase